MNKILLAGALAAVLVVTAAVAQQTATPAVSTAQSYSADEQGIRLLSENFTKAYNTGDAKAVAGLFVADGEIVNQARESIQGRQAIERVFADIFRTHPKSQISVSIQSIRLLHSATAVEDGTSTVTYPSGQRAEQNRYMVVYAKQDGQWRMATARDLPDETASAAEEIKQLEWLIGEWVDESPDAVVMTSYGWADENRSIQSEFRVHIAGRSAMAGTQRIAWDPQTKKLHCWVYDSEGGYAEGAWNRSGDQWIVKMTGVSHEGRPASSTNVISRAGKDRMTWQSRDRVVGDEIMPNIEPVVIVRKAPNPR